MNISNRYDELVSRNRFRRARDLGFALLLAAVTALAAGSISSAGDAPAAVAVPTVTPTAAT